MGEFNQARYIQGYMKEKYDRCAFDVPKGARKPLQMIIKARYKLSLAEYIKRLICADLGLSDLSELIPQEADEQK